MKEDNKKVMSIFIVAFIFVILMIIVVFKNGNSEEYSTDDLFDLHVSADFDKDEILEEGYPTLLDVGGADCVPCKAMAPVLEKLNEDLNGEAIIKFVDYWEYPALANQFQFSVIPTQFFYDENGELYTTHEGQLTEEKAYEIFAEMGYEF